MGREHAKACGGERVSLRWWGMYGDSGYVTGELDGGGGLDGDRRAEQSIVLTIYSVVDTSAQLVTTPHTESRCTPRSIVSCL
jgi:hypothetical protein